ncbi:MAG: nickel pincer cofactor biosynthesis protein LarB [Deltaproteobacteria bacterium]|nr:nickel pincer cofactor biosynthesis protein LarB [Deltaproteobacteria bacterium]
MNVENIKRLLTQVQSGGLSVDEALDHLKNFPFEQASWATIDHHRALRQGSPEVIFGQGKTTEEIIGIVRRLLEAGDNILVTRLSPDFAPEILQEFPTATFNHRARCLTIVQTPLHVNGRGKIVIISAGTSDRPVAEEALITAQFLGHDADHLADVGVAGLHRLLGQMDRLAGASVFIVVAGMEGALPSVVGGLVDKPVIAVPTSVGYGASFHGLSALLGMLNSCASNVAVVNIDNGFGAAFVAGMINRA